MGKGGNWERTICKDLSKWIQGTEKPYLFWRQALSGGLATISELNKDMSGDIRPIVSEVMDWWPFSVECKTGYPKTSFWQHFKNIKTFNIKSFWKQCCDDAEKSNKIPMLIYRKLGRRSIVGIDLPTFYAIDNIVTISDLSSVVLNWNDIMPSVIFFDQKDFFEMVKPDDIKEIFT